MDTAAAAVAASTDIESGDFDDSSNNTKAKEAAAGVSAVGIGTIDDTKDEDFDPITLPQSTHTLLFTEPVCSKSFQFSVAIATLSILCLLLALTNNGITLDGIGQVPANVGMSVKIAQFASIFIALLMEEEIPTGLYLLRRIPKTYFKSKFPELCYSKFVAAAILRIFMGYLFLVNVLFLLMMSDNVIDIFFDFIALQFLQQLDDISFNLARMGVFSKSLRVATTSKYFRTEFRRQTKVKRSKRIGFFLKAIYFINLMILLAAQIYVTVKQGNGDYQCKSITVIIKDEVWEESVVKMPGEESKAMVLVYPYFNGSYNQDGTSHDGRPVYVEQKKFDGTPFDTTFPDPVNISVKIPARIQYCKSIRAWVFMHEYIRKSTHHEDSECPWLLRSEETDVYDIEEVQGPWQVWAGVIGKTDVDITCNECNDNADCNLNGECKKDGKCECFKDVEGVQFIGQHCEVRLKDDCHTIYGEEFNDTWSVVPVGWGKGLFQEYDRPVYVYQGGNPLIDDDNDAALLIYSGDRWFGLYQPGWQFLFGETFEPFFKASVMNYHAFWDRAYNSGTVIVSDPTTGDTPVGVDFYLIGERGNQFGPYGALYPLQLNNQTGRGYFRCNDTNPYLYGDPFQNMNITGPGRRMLHTEGMFDNLFG
mmetsp:Transcript_2542/g.3810  ORF Transcript_2542/g.3810 Transcript_2542/m.3810 type:complete len:648 (+) Transcript_2542:57-2000(+)